MLATTLALAVLCPALLIVFSRGAANRAACKGNLVLIGMRLRGYADDHGGRFPAGLAELYPKYVESPGVFSCPSRPTRGQNFVAGAAGGDGCGYVYLPGRDVTLPGNFILAHDRFENHRGRGANVVCLDGSVEWYAAERLPELRKTLAEQEAQFGGLRRKWEEQKAADTTEVEAFLRRMDKHVMVDLKNVPPEEGLKFIVSLAEVSAVSDKLPAMPVGKTVTLQHKDAALGAVLDSWCSQVGADWTIAETGGGAPGTRKFALVIGRGMRIDELNLASPWIAGMVRRSRAKASAPETGK